MNTKQNIKENIVGLYMRLSRDDDHEGESLSIDNQRRILRKYAEEQGFKVYDEYIDDGISGTTFNRPGVQRLLDDAKNGIINVIVVKDLSRFGRNYVEFGQYIDFIFPTFGVRFIAIQDGIDTENRNSVAMDMMPMMNVFNEWHCSVTSKKIRTVLTANAKAGKYHSSKAPYGYVKGDDKNHLPIIDPDAAEVVKRIFEMRASGISTNRIADILNAENISCPLKYLVEHGINHAAKSNTMLWTSCAIRAILANQTYLGHLVQQKTTTVSYKNHKVIKKNASEYIVVHNTHEPIISQELWDKVKEVEHSKARGKKTKRGFTHCLSGFLYCPDCGSKMKLSGVVRDGKNLLYYNCGDHMRIGKAWCFSHNIPVHTIEKIILDDIRQKISMVIDNEESVRNEYIRKNAEINASAVKAAEKELRKKSNRLIELKQLIKSIYEDKVKGIIPEDVCVRFINEYTNEEKQLEDDIDELNSKLTQTQEIKTNVDEFINCLKRNMHIPALTREICYELIDRIYVGPKPKVKGEPRQINIIYKVDINSTIN